jgi:hypothetical protein
MVKVVVRKIDAKKRTRRSSIAKTRVRDASGKIVRYFTIDARSPTFEEDLTRVYKSNVSKARSENKKRFGAPDRAGRFIHRMK